MVRIVSSCIAWLAAGACGCNEPRPLALLTVQSEAFDFGRRIPEEYTCDGAGHSPPLSWTGAPLNTASFALIVDDPDAPRPEAPATTVVHWLLYDIPMQQRTLAAALDAPPEGALAGLNARDEAGYFAPCPGKGRHRYFFQLFALDTQLGDLDGPTKTDLLDAMAHHVIGYGELVGRYERHRP
jgi:Raf kinase inhibitor-like YbhB/YbcL family protein